MNSDDAFDFLADNEKNIYEFASQELQTAGMHVNTILLRKFNEMFKKDEKGQTREWRDIEGGEQAILDLFKKCKANIDEIILSLKEIELPKFCTQPPDEPNSMIGDIKKLEEDDDFLVVPTVPLRNKMSLTKRSTFSQDFINRVQEKFNEDADFSHEEAINRFKNIN